MKEEEKSNFEGSDLTWELNEKSYEKWTRITIIVQGVPYWSVPFELALTDRNMQVRFFFNVILESWDDIFLGITTSFCKMLNVHPLLDQM